MKEPFLGFVATLLVASACCLGVFAQTSGPESDQSADAKLSTATSSPHDLDGVWMGASGSAGGAPLVDPNGHPPFTPWGQMRFDASFPSLGPRDIPGKENDPILKCYPDGIPKQLGSPHPFEIFTLRDRVLMTFEKDHDWRQIWTDGRKHSVNEGPTFNGHSTGRWDGDTFVVDSTGFSDIPWLDYYGDPHSESMHLTEYYKRVDHDTLSISVTIDDPKAYAEIWVGKPHFYKLKDWEILDYYCTIDDIQQYDKDLRIPAGATAGGGKTAKSDKK